MRLALYLAILVMGCAAPAPPAELFGDRLDEARSFSETTPPPPPDYNDARAWAAFPGIANASDAFPPGASFLSPEKSVDVFFVHPTTYRSSILWNQDISNAGVNAWTDASTIARQAGVFNDCCRIFAPRYRQASFRAIEDPTLSGDGGDAYRLAYEDVLRAFDHYLANDNQGRAFIIAGHSQGALMSYWLLRDRIDSTASQSKLVAAYIVGLDLMEGDFSKTFKSLKPCDKPDQTGCILSWNAVTPDLDLELIKGAAGGRYARVYGTDEGRVPVCVNPVTNDVSEPVSLAPQGRGAVPGEPGFGPLRPLAAGRIAARCEQGFLVVIGGASLDLEPLPGGSMHYHDFSLFYEDIRHNIRSRISSAMPGMVKESQSTLE